MELTGNENLFKVTVRFPEISPWIGSRSRETDAYVIADSLDAAVSATGEKYKSGKVVSVTELSISVIVAHAEPVAPPSQKEKP